MCISTVRSVSSIRTVRPSYIKMRQYVTTYEQPIAKECLQKIDQGFIFKTGRHNSEQVAKDFNHGLPSQQHVRRTTPKSYGSPLKLEFDFDGGISFNLPAVESDLDSFHKYKKYSANFRVAKGGKSEWWIASPDCKQVAPNPGQEECVLKCGDIGFDAEVILKMHAFRIASPCERCGRCRTIARNGNTLEIG